MPVEVLAFTTNTDDSCGTASEENGVHPQPEGGKRKASFDHFVVCSMASAHGHFVTDPLLQRR
jgi:hypothetical protein